MKKVIETIILFLIIILSSLLIFGPKRINFLGKTYLSNTKNIDLSNATLELDDNWQQELRKFKKLEKVDFGYKTILKSEKDYLINAYPNVKFNVTSIVQIYGINVKENAKALDLSNVKIDDNIYTYLDLLPNLEYVDFGTQNVDKSKQLFLTEKYPQILFDWQVQIADTKVSSMIESLSLSDKNINDLNSLYNSLKILKKLKFLDMGNTNLSNEELGKMREDFPHIKIDWVIYFGVWKIRTDDIAFSVLISNFPYKRLTSEDLEFLKYCTELQALDLGHQKITDISVIADNLPELRILILADNKITDITPLKKLKHLHYLELFINNISDISSLEGNSELVDLNLCYNRIKDFSPLLKLKKLERLWLVGTGVSNNTVDKLKNIYLDADIIKDGSGSTGNGWRSHSRYFKMIDMFHKRNYISEEFTKYD